MTIGQTDYFGFIEISLQGFWWTRNNSNAYLEVLGSGESGLFVKSKPKTRNRRYSRKP